MKAYPIMYKHPTTGLIVEHEGMELRDWFAGVALQGMLADTKVNSYADTVQLAYGMADAMMKQREVKNV
jgi:hypothetical protein